MRHATSLAFFARHELRLAWREAAARLRGGRRGRTGWTLVALAVFTGLMHLVAAALLRSSAQALVHPDKAFLVTATGSLALAWLLFVSQAMETATRGFYARADLDLILSSPAPARRLFALRVAAIALTTAAMAAVIAGPMIDVAALLAGPAVLMAYGVLAATATTAACVAVAASALLFRLVGPRRTRLLAQIVAAIIGAGFVVGIQAVAILSYGSTSRVAVLQSPTLAAAAPGLSSPAWWPVRAALGDGRLLVGLLIAAAALLALTMVGTAGAFARNAALVASLPGAPPARRAHAGFRSRSRAASLRRKEWTLLRRDPWLVSQSLMQVLYLLPPALMLWHSYGGGSDGGRGGNLVVLVPVLVMAAGQLAGGLAWLALSGEDAPDLVATAPVTEAAVLRAKIEAVFVAVALPLVPLVAAMAWAAPALAVVTSLGAACAAAGASAVQYVFRARGKRSNFSRRQTASRVATFAEAFVSIAVAASAGLAAAGFWLAVVPMAVAAGLILACRALAPPAA